MSSAMAWLRASQWAKRSRSGRIDSNKRTMGSPFAAPADDPSKEETGVSGPELRVPLIVASFSSWQAKLVGCQGYRSAGTQGALRAIRGITCKRCKTGYGMQEFQRHDVQ